MNISPASPNVGAVIQDADLKNLSDEDFSRLRRVIAENCMVVIRNQFLQPQDHLRFGERFGKLVMTLGTEGLKPEDSLTGLGGFDKILKLQNLGKTLNGRSHTEVWHTDNSHVPRPTYISILAAQHIPECGGDTMFSNQYRAYDTLSEGMKSMVKGLRLKHTGALQQAYMGKSDAETPFALHPVAIKHPVSGRKSLYIGGGPDASKPNFEHLTPAESRPILQFLLEHSIKPEHVYRHRWQPGDVVIWDNLTTLHYAIHDYGTARRDMHRVTVEGEAPIAAD